MCMCVHVSHVFKRFFFFNFDKNVIVVLLWYMYLKFKKKYFVINFMFLQRNNIFNLLYQFNQINVIQFQKYTCYYVWIFSIFF